MISLPLPAYLLVLSHVGGGSGGDILWWDVSGTPCARLPPRLPASGSPAAHMGCCRPWWFRLGR